MQIIMKQVVSIIQHNQHSRGLTRQYLCMCYPLFSYALSTCIDDNDNIPDDNIFINNDNAGADREEEEDEEDFRHQ